MVCLQNKTKALQLLLALGALYFTIGAAAHGFGLTIFPLYDGRLYSSYHDMIIAAAALVVAIFLLAIARDPVKNIDGLKAIIVAGVVAAVFTAGSLWKFDFAALGAPAKKAQTAAELILLIIWLVALVYLRPKEPK